MSLNNDDPFVESWSILLPDGTYITDEIEYGPVVSIVGIEMIAKRNRRRVVYSDGHEEWVAVPENFEDNRKQLVDLLDKWEDAKRKHEENISNRGIKYMSYIEWMDDNVPGTSLTSLLFASAPKNISSPMEQRIAL
jgi:hypothetical protein